MGICLMVNGTRVLTPAEIRQLRGIMIRPSSRLLFDVLLYTGLRYSEVSQIYKEPERFDPDRKAVVINNGKKMAVLFGGSVRYVILSPKGVQAIRDWLAEGRKPVTPVQWRNNLKTWAHRSGLTTIPGMIDTATSKEVVDEKIENVWGISVMSTRKTWECYLLATYPHKAESILRSLGHSRDISERHYVKVADLFTPEERVEIRDIVSGWNDAMPHTSVKMEGVVIRAAAQ